MVRYGSRGRGGRGVASTANQVLKRLGEWEAREGLSPSLELYRRLLCIQSEVGIGKPCASLDKETASRRMVGGLPLLGFDDLAIDWALLEGLIEKIASLLTEYPEFSVRVLPKLSEASLREVARAWFERKPLPAIDGTDESLLEFVLQAALKPFLASHAEALIGLVNQEDWRRGHCPVCGGNTDLAFLDRETGARWLFCSRCDAQWLFQRLECPHCGNQEPGKLAYFTDDRGLYRLYACEKCRRYLKAIDLRRAECVVLLPLERYLTLHLDVQAQRDGYGLTQGLDKVKG